MSTLIAAIRSLATYLARLALRPARRAAVPARSRCSSASALLLYRVGLGGVRLGLCLERHHASRSRAASTSSGNGPRSTPSTTPATSSRRSSSTRCSELFPRLRILYKAELRKLPILVRAFDLAGFVPLERGNPEQSLPAIERAAEALREGNSFLIFPEGTRSRTGELLPFKKGGFIMAMKGQAPVVPVAIAGARDAMRKGSLSSTPSASCARRRAGRDRRA